MGSDLKHLPPGQRAILRTFERHGLDGVYVPSDLMDLRVCSAMAANGVLSAFVEGDLRGYELAEGTRAALSSQGGDHG